MKSPTFAQAGDQQTLGALGSGIVEGADQFFHVCGDFRTREVTVRVCRAVGRVIQAVGDLKQPLMRFGQIASGLPVMLQGTLHLKQQTLEIAAAIQG